MPFWIRGRVEACASGTDDEPRQDVRVDRPRGIFVADTRIGSRASAK